MAKNDADENKKKDTKLPSSGFEGDDVNEPAPIRLPKAVKPVKWTADDFTTHDKSPLWYVSLVAITFAATALIYLITRDKITSAVVFIAGIIFGAYAAHKPNAISYILNNDGLMVGKKLYNFSNFRSFSVVDEQKFTTILFVPFKRFMPAITVHCSRDTEDKVVDFLSGVLPVDNHGNDIVDRFLRRINY